ncbi:hypothetical protein COCAGNCG_03612 [Aeromonas dhakensis]
MGPLAVLFSVLATVWNYVYNIGFVTFYLVYAFVYNWSYDKVYPIPGQWQQNALG